jgi:hypothetical protein
MDFLLRRGQFTASGEQALLPFEVLEAIPMTRDPHGSKAQGSGTVIEGIGGA